MNLLSLTPSTRMVVFDDDPTGIQTVHSCLLVTEWSDQNIRLAMQDSIPFFYILTNTRALTPQQARERLTDAMEAVLRVNREFGYRLICISRSDSCLRGHFPLETDVMCEVLQAHGIAVWPRIPFVPAFIESGRFTIDGIHYMHDGTKLIPVSETEFARDNVFGYHSSRLTDYIVEKGADPSRYEPVDAENYDMLNAYRDRLFADIEGWQGSVVIRSSSSLPRAMSGIEPRALLSRQMLGIESPSPGCFVVGSHVRKTTEQLSHLLQEEGTQGIELSIQEILDHPDTLLASTLSLAAQSYSQGITPVIYTARQEVRIDDPDKRQQLGQLVSDFLVQIVRHLPFRPSYLVAKGGITSHDILCQGLQVKTARVMGQAINSVPCILTEHFPYIIFPGNVGGPDSLAEIYRKFSNA